MSKKHSPEIEDDPRSQSNNSKEKTNLFVNSFDTNFYKNLYENEINQDQSACHLINLANNVQSSNNLLPSISNQRHLCNAQHPSTICYQTFKDENSPFNSPLKRSSTFAGVFNAIFKQQSDYNHLLEPKSYLQDDKKSTNKLRYSKSYYDDFENRFSYSEPSSNHKELITSTTSLLSNYLDMQNIRKSLLSMAVALTKRSTSNTGRIFEQHQTNFQHKKKSFSNSLSNSASTTTTSSSSDNNTCSIYTNNETSTVIALPEDVPSFNHNFCALCIQFVDQNEFVILENCRCGFCRSCLEQYCTIIIRDHYLTSSQITCPSSDCPNSNSYLTTQQIQQLVDRPTFNLYEKIKLDLEVHLDPNRVWCPRPNCETVCLVNGSDLKRFENDDLNSSFDNSNDDIQTTNDQKIDRRIPVTCKKCSLTFCLHCRRPYHGKMPCQSPSEDDSLSLLLSRTKTPNSLNEYIKKCPKCGIFIERDRRGCAQMMCQKCQHVFCWYCLKSLEEDFLLRHYDSGSCKNKLGHSQGTLIWLRFQVVAVFIGFALFLLLLSPFLLISAPILLIAHYFCNLSITTKVWSKEDFIDSTEQSQQNLSILNRQQSNKTTFNLNEATQSSNSNDDSQLIDLNNDNKQSANEFTINKHEQLIQAYIEKNGSHRLISLDQSLDLDNNVLDGSLFEEHPIKLSGYEIEREDERKESKFLSWFNWKRNKSKLDPPPRLSSMLDVEKHRKFIEELMADKLSLDHQMNSEDLDKNYMIISRAEIVNDDSNFSGGRSKFEWLKFWKK